MRFLDAFLLHCLMHESPPDTLDQMAEMARNQQRTAAQGREPGLMLERQGQNVLLTEWAAELLAQIAPLAAALDAAHGGTAYADVVVAAEAAAAAPDTLPSARVLSAMQRDFEGNFTAFVRAQSDQARNHLLALPWAADTRPHSCRPWAISTKAMSR